MGNGQTFNPREHIISIKTNKGPQDYLEVKWRIAWFRQECPGGTIHTELVHLDLDKDVEAEVFVWNADKRRSDKVIKKANGVAIFRAVVTDGKGASATGTKSENAANFPDFIEKSESGAIGRALAALGYGTQFASEFDEGDRIVDAPVERPTNGRHAGSNGNSANSNAAPSSSQGQQEQGQGQASRTGNSQRSNNGIHTPAPQGQQGQIDPNAAATEQQISSIKKLCQHLEKPEPDNLSNLTFLNAKQLLQQFSEEYRAQKQRKAS